MAIKQVKSVAAVAPINVPCGTRFSSLGLPSTLSVTFDDNSNMVLPISWLFGKYDPWDNISRSMTLKGAIVLSTKYTGDSNDYNNSGNIEASCMINTTALVGQLNPPVGKEDCFLNSPGQPTAN